ncbi:hypothetical protein ACRRTK_002852 [Alexandromys fortis]
MMHICDSSSNQKRSLLHAMQRFIGAVNTMDQTVLVPSLLRDVPVSESDDNDDTEVGVDVEVGGGRGRSAHAHGSFFAPPPPSPRDMYSHYVLLKSIRDDIEWGVLQQQPSSPPAESAWECTDADTRGGLSRPLESPDAAGEEEDLDLERQFRFHLRGLHAVLSKLTRKADVLTSRYKREVGFGDWGQ